VLLMPPGLVAICFIGVQNDASRKSDADTIRPIVSPARRFDSNIVRLLPLQASLRLQRVVPVIGVGAERLKRSFGRVPLFSNAGSRSPGCLPFDDFKVVLGRFRFVGG